MDPATKELDNSRNERTDHDQVPQVSEPTQANAEDSSNGQNPNSNLPRSLKMGSTKDKKSSKMRSIKYESDSEALQNSYSGANKKAQVLSMNILQNNQISS
jgi:hypothetical protein